MAHEIETMAYANQVPWHGLGAQVSPDSTPEEFLVAAGLDWKVNLHPMQSVVDGESVTIPGRYALIRNTDKKVMTVCGSSWRPMQNSDTLDFMNRYVTAGGAKMETAGSLRDGKVVWALAKLGTSFQVRPGDRVEGYLLITSPHVVGQAITIRTTTVRVVCANTMALAERGGQIAYRQNHLSDFDIDAARERVASANESLFEAEKRAKTLDQLKLSTVDIVSKVLLPVFAPDAEADLELDVILDLNPKIAHILDSIKNAPGAIEDTGWGVLNGVTHWADHTAGRTNESRMYRSWMGDYGVKKLEVEQKLMELAA